MDTVPDPKIEDPRDAIVRITSTCICGSDLHLYDGYMPTMEEGDILGHEPMGEVVEGRQGCEEAEEGRPRRRALHDLLRRAAGSASGQLYSLCDNTNPNAEVARKAWGSRRPASSATRTCWAAIPAARPNTCACPFADVGPHEDPDGLPDEKVVFLSDIFPTGYMAAENARSSPGDTVAVWGCGPVAQFAIQSAWMLGAGPRDRHRPRARTPGNGPEDGKAETINFEKREVYDRLMEMTQGRGPTAASTRSAAKRTAGQHRRRRRQGEGSRRPGDRPAHALREAIMCCRKGGTVSVPGVYVGFLDKIPFGAPMNKGLTFKTGQTHVQRYSGRAGENRSRRDRPVLRHHPPPAARRRPRDYKTFRDKKDGCIKVVLQP